MAKAQPLLSKNIFQKLPVKLVQSDKIVMFPVRQKKIGIISLQCTLALMLVPPGGPKSQTRRRRRRRAAAHLTIYDWREFQLPLPFDFPEKRSTPLMTRIYESVKRFAAARMPMPTNINLGQMMDGRGRQSIAKALDRLVASRQIRIDLKKGKRRVYVVCSGSITGWGDHRKGHAPYSLNPRGTVKKQIEKPISERIYRADGFSFLGISRMQDYSFRMAVLNGPGDIGPALKCQYIEAGSFCNKKSRPGKSWCDTHCAVCFA